MRRDRVVDEEPLALVRDSPRWARAETAGWAGGPVVLPLNAFEVCLECVSEGGERWRNPKKTRRKSAEIWRREAKFAG